MAAACLSGLIYFAAIFTFAFVMGIARVLVIAPRLGTTAAVLLEVPILIAASWVVARRLLRDRSFVLHERAAMGAIAFTLTMASEAVLSRVMREESIIEWAASLVTPLGLIGLAGQVAFAAMPVLAGHSRTDTSPRT